MIMFCVWEYQTFFTALASWIFWGKFVLRFAKPISDPRESFVLFSGLHFLCPYLEVNRFGHP
jgi:hypothetical protein